VIPVVEWRGAADPDAPLAGLFHGRGSDEHAILELVDLLPEGLAFAALRGPIPFGDGYAWFENQGVGRPAAESLAQQTRRFRDWPDGVAPAPRPVMLIGFSGGAVFHARATVDNVIPRELMDAT
jgi:phospholipase/carboxylesterase